MATRNKADEREPLLNSSNDGQSNDHYQFSNGKPYIVEFDKKGDPDNPQEWPTLYRWGIVGLLMFTAFTVTFTCIGIVPVASRVVIDLEGHKDKSATVLFVTIWELGEAAGPLFIAPLSEIYGRYPVHNVCNVGLIVGIIITALSQDIGLLIFARFLSGCAVASNVLNPAIIGDLFPPESRGAGMSVVLLAPLVGGAVGPSVAGAVAQATGWRVIMWMALGLAGAAELCFLTLFRETYKVKILRQRAARLRLETGNDAWKTEFDDGGDESSWLFTILKAMTRPFEVLFGSFILQALSLWGALVFTFFYVMSTSLPDMLEDIYHLSPAFTGVSFLSFSLGSILGISFCNLLVDRVYLRLRTYYEDERLHEARLPIPVIGAFGLPLTVALYGWAAGLHLSVWVLLVSVVLLGFFVLLAIVPTYVYITDAFGVYSASAMTAVLTTRCLMGTFLPLAVPPLTDKVGYGWCFTILAAVCLLLAPVPPLILRYGPSWRQHSRFTRDDEN